MAAVIGTAVIMAAGVFVVALVLVVREAARSMRDERGN